MTARDDGGPAFPCGYNMSTENGASEPANVPTKFGLSLRDYFAAAAMAAIAKEQSIHPAHGHTQQFAFAQVAARCAYYYADAMIAERAK